MKRLLACALVACGGRTNLGGVARADAGSISAACADAVDEGAFTPVDRYCSDNSNRARAIAPKHPQVAWTQPVVGGTNLGLLVDAQSNAYLGDVQSFDVHGNARWNVDAQISGFGVLLPSSLLVESWTSPSATRFAQSSGAGGPMTWPLWGSRIAAGADGTFFVELISLESFGSGFAGVARVDAMGATMWIERGDCDPGGSDLPAPHDFVRRDDHLVIVCNRKEHDTVEVLEVDANDTKVLDDSLDGSLSGGIALEPNGTLAFFVGDQTNATLVTIDRVGNSSLAGPTFPSPTIAAVAADGTLIVTSANGLAAVAPGMMRWQKLLSIGARLFVDDGSTIVVATSAAMAFDVATGEKMWEVPLSQGDVYALASGGPGKVYILQESALTLLAD